MCSGVLSRYRFIEDETAMSPKANFSDAEKVPNASNAPNFTTFLAGRYLCFRKCLEWVKLSLRPHSPLRPITKVQQSFQVLGRREVWLTLRSGHPASMAA
jgi:hypothetical protein